ncbi:MAG: AbrB/MazE/SpoVT family DNA-binding domain-containing protein [Terracidiphilus sp.]|jgi:AbrB family looped-hinge helix DNA binding protein
MGLKTSATVATVVEAKVTSKGQVTLPKALRSHLGLKKGSRIRFTLNSKHGFKGEHLMLSLEDLFKRADSGPKSKGTMSLEDMNRAKARRIW